MKEEFAIGETFQFGIKTLKVVPDDDTCKDCALQDLCFTCYFFNHEDYVGFCEGEERKDKTSVIFKELEVDGSSGEE